MPTTAAPAAAAPALLAALDAVRAGLTIFDSRGRLVHANAHLNYLLPSLPPCQTLIGLTYEELIGLEIAGGEIGPAALAQGVPAFIARRLAQLGEGAYAPCDIALADRRVIEIKARRSTGGLTVLLWSDVTAARAQLARLEEAVALSAEAFAFFDFSDRLILANALYAQLCGVANLDALMGKTFPQIAALVAHSGRIHLDETPQAWLERRLKGHRTAAGASTLTTSTGESYLVRDRATPDGGRVIVFTDITDKVRAETALAEQTHALVAANAQAATQSRYLADLSSRLDHASAAADSAKTTLLRTMGHELKTPLNAILGFSELMATLADTLKPDQIREYAGLVHQGGQNLLKIINQIMDLTKIAAGRYDLHKAPLDVGAVLWLVREDFLERAGRRGIAIDADHCPVGLMADADESVFTVMMHNLIDNAVTFTPDGGRIALSAQAHPAGIQISVEDNGPGVAATDLARILEPFEHGGKNQGADHADAEGIHHTKGAGLGLTLVKAFAELQDGRLELSSEPGKGFRASVLLAPSAP